MSEQLRKQVVLDVDVNASEANNELKNLGNTLDNINNKPVDKPFKEIRKEIKAATEEAQRMALEFSKDSTQFKTAAKRVNELREEFKKTNEAVASFNPDAKLNALIGVSHGAVSAVQGVAGAMAFLGVETEDAAQTLVKLQGIMAFADALGSLKNLQDNFKGLNLAIQGNTILSKANAAATSLTSAAYKALGISVTTTSVAFKALKAAIIATGIGALVVGITALVSKISDWVSGTDRAKEANDRLTDSLAKLKQQMKDYDDTLQYARDVAIEYAREMGKSEAEIQKIRRNYLVESREDAIRGLTQSEKQLSEERKKLSKEDREARDKEIDDLRRQVQAKTRELELFDRRDAADQAEEKRKKLKEINEKASAERKAALEKDKQLYEEERKALEQHLKELEEISNESIRSIAERGLSEKEKELFALKENYKAQVRTLEDTRTEELAFLDKSYNKGKISFEQYQLAKIKAEEKYNDIGTNLSIDYQGKKFEIEKHYTDIIKEFIANETTSEFEQRKAAIVKTYDDLIKVANEKEKEVLEMLKQQKLADADTLEGLRIGSIEAETKVVTTEVDNKILETDTPAERVSKLQAVYQSQVELENAQFAEKLERLKGQDAEIELAKAQHNAKLTKLADEQAEAEKAIDEAVKQAKLDNMQAIGSAAGSLSSLIGQQTVAGKALGIAQATIDTYVGANKAIAQGGIAGIAAAVGIIATGLANVKKIVSTKVPAKTGDTATTAPVATVAPIINSTQLSPASTVQDVRVINPQDQQVRAYVSLDEIRTQEERQQFFDQIGNI